MIERPGHFGIRIVTWREEAASIRAVREAVFVREQGIPERLEWDGLDPECIHVLAEDRRLRPVGTGRLAPGGRIGRMAVLAGWRGRGVGTGLLEMLLRAAGEAGHGQVYLHAQLPVRAFYARHGFRCEGPPFREAGIEHVRMARGLALPLHGRLPPPDPNGRIPR